MPLLKMKSLVKAIAGSRPNRDADRRPLNLSHQDQDQHDYEQQTQTAARVVAPTSAMRPGRYGAEQQHNQDDQENEPHLSDPLREALRGRRFESRQRLIPL